MEGELWQGQQGKQRPRARKSHQTIWPARPMPPPSTTSRCCRADQTAHRTPPNISLPRRARRRYHRPSGAAQCPLLRIQFDLYHAQIVGGIHRRVRKYLPVGEPARPDRCGALGATSRRSEVSIPPFLPHDRPVSEAGWIGLTKQSAGEGPRTGSTGRGSSAFPCGIRPEIAGGIGAGCCGA